MWKAKAHPTAGEVAHAIALLPPVGTWKLGLIHQVEHIQYRGAMHLNASDSGTHPGVEVWTDIPEDQYGATPMAEDLGTTTPAERELVLAAAEAQGYPRDEVDAAVMVESGWKPHNWYHGVAPEKAAGGLIGFMPFVLKNLGWKKGGIAFRAQSSGEQAPWVGKYFAQVKGQWRYPGDTYVALAAGGYVGKADSFVVYKKGTPAYDLNRGWDTNKDGQITVGDLRAFAVSHMKGYSAPKPSPKAEVGGSSSVVYFLDLSASLSTASVASLVPGEKVSSAVKVVQNHLQNQGYYTGKIDGLLGPKTLGAIQRYLKQ